MLPRPSAIRLVAHDSSARTPSPPLGLRAWSEQASAMAIVLDGDASDLRAVAGICAQLPAAGTLPPQTLVVIFGRAERPKRRFALARMLGKRRTIVPRALRCSALLARGYVELGAGVDPDTGEDLAWGSTPALR